MTVCISSGCFVFICFANAGSFFFLKIGPLGKRSVGSCLDSSDGAV